MTRLLVTASALAAALAVAAGSRDAPVGAFPPGVDDPPVVCKSGSDGGTKPKPHGLLMVADHGPVMPCAQGG